MKTISTLAACLLFASLTAAQQIPVGQIANEQAFAIRSGTQFTDTNFAAYQGKILIVMMMTPWCPFCQSNASAVGDGLLDYYFASSRGSLTGKNANGVPIASVMLSTEPAAQWDSVNQSFSTTNGYAQWGLDANSSRGNPRVLLGYFRGGFINSSNLYDWGNDRRRVVVLNMVSGSPSHALRQIVINQNYYTSSDNVAARAAIDAIQPSTPNGITITTQPASTTIPTGQSTTLSVVASGDAPLTYAWFRGTSGDTSTPVGTNSASFTTPTLTQTTSYWVRVSNAANPSGFNSVTATITVLQPAGITTSPASTSVSFGQSTTLDVQTTGSGTLTYQWYEGTSGVTTTPVGGNSASFNTPVLTAARTYWVRVSNAVNPAGVNSAAATVSVLPITPTYPAPAPPAALATDLFVDHFQRANSNDSDSADGGMSGSRASQLGVGSTYYEGHEGNGIAESIRISNGQLQLAVGQDTAETGLMHNFIGQDIVAAGGFSVEMNVVELHNTGDSSSERYVGFGVGLQAGEAATGGDLYSSDSFRSRADFFIDLDASGHLKVWNHGQLLEAIPVAVTRGTITAKFALDGFSTASTVTVAVYFNGQPLDIDTANESSTTRSFTWETDDTNYIGLSARTVGFASIDNLAIRKLPLTSNLALSYALAAGLSGADTSPDADSDRDGRSNFLEWVIGSNPAIADVGIAPLRTLVIDPAQGRYRFQVRRLASRAAFDLNYTVMVSTNLNQWFPVSATEVSAASPAPGSPGYETVELELPPAMVLGQNRLFVIMAANPGL